LPTSGKADEAQPRPKSSATPIESEEISLIEYRCQSCNAAYPLGADDVIATCPYCGYTFEVDTGKTLKHSMIPNRLAVQEASEVVRNWIASVAARSVGSHVAKAVDIETPMLQWLPMIRVDADCRTHYSGGKKTQTGVASAYWTKIENETTSHEPIWVLARRHASDFGVEEFVDSIGDAESVTFDIKAIQSALLLNSELEETDAQPRARVNKVLKDRNTLLRTMTSLFDYQLEMNFKSCSYIHAPYWLVPYTYHNGTFRVALSGVTGQVLCAEVPVTKRYKASQWLKSLGLLISSALLFLSLPIATFFILQFASGSSGEAILLPLIILFGAAVLWAESVKTLGRVLRYQITMTADGKSREKGDSLKESLKIIAEVSS